MKKIILIYISMFILMYAQEPSYEDTVKFIDKKTNLIWKDNNGKITAKQYIRFEQCTMYIFEEHYYGDKSVDYNMKRIVKLKDLDPTRFKIGEDVINRKVLLFYTKENKPLIKAYFKGYSKGYKKWHSCSEENSPCTDDVYVEKIYGLDPAEVNLPKLVRALQHISKLCGAKGELF